MSYYEKYLKYKNKYLRLKSLTGGDKVEDCKGKDWSHFLEVSTKSTNVIIEELLQKLINPNSFFKLSEIHTYLEALNGYWARYHACHQILDPKNVPKQTCTLNLDKISRKILVDKPVKQNLFQLMVNRWKVVPGITSVNRLIQEKAPDYHAWVMLNGATA
jgi:hypothetical protein